MTELQHTDRSQWVAHTEGLRGLARHLVGPDDADDHVQDTWVAALDKPPPTRSPRAWFRQVLRNSVRARARRARRWDELQPLVVQDESAPRPDEYAEAEEVSRVLAEVLNDLDEPYRIVLRERFYGDRSLTEIAEHLGCPDGTVRWRVHEGLRRMRQELDRRFGERSRWYGAVVVLGGFSTGAEAPASMGATMSTSTKIKAIASTVALSGLACVGYVACMAHDEEATVEPSKSVESTEVIDAESEPLPEASGRVASSTPSVPRRSESRPRRAASEATEPKEEAPTRASIERDAEECEQEFIVPFNAAPDDAGSVEYLVDAAQCFEEAGVIGKAIHIHNALAKQFPDSEYLEASKEARSRLFWAVVDPETGLETKVGRDCVAQMPDESAESYIKAADCMYYGISLAGAALEYRKRARKRPGALDTEANEAAIVELEGVVARYADRLGDEPAEE